MHPSGCYEHIFPSALFDLNRIAYYFDHGHEPAAVMQNGGEIFARVAEWQRRWKEGPRPSLSSRQLLDAIMIQDARCAGTRTFLYGEKEAALYEFCDDLEPLPAILEHFNDDREWITSALAEWLERGFMLFLDDRYLSLALPPSHHG